MINKRIVTNAISKARRIQSNETIRTRKIITLVNNYLLIRSITEFENNDESISIDTIANAKSLLIDKITFLLEQTDNEEILNLFRYNGTIDVQTFLEAPIDIRKEKIDWLESHLNKTLTENKVNSKTTTIIQKLYDEDPRRALHWYAWKHTSPEFKINL